MVEPQHGAPNPDGDERKALESFVVENQDLERLEGLLAEFNLFEAIGAVRSELRHSAMLAFLLNPAGTHGLGDAFIRRFLQRALFDAAAERAPVSPVKLDVWDLGNSEVRREWSNIDILVVDGRNKLVIVIENKIGSTEHSDQLRRYGESVRLAFPGYQVVGIFLTPDGEEPSDESYLCVDYGVVADVVEYLLKTRESTIGKDVGTLLRHYAQMLRRHIVSDSEIAELCRALYVKHRQALDLIFEHRPDPQTGEIHDFIENSIGNDKRLQLDDCSKAYIRFAPKQWDVPSLSKGAGWTKTGRMLLFEFSVSPTKVVLRLLLGPGPAATREQIFKIARETPTVFKGTSKSIATKWNQIYKRTVLDMTKSEDTGVASMQESIAKEWSEFLSKDLPAIENRLAAEEWLWAPETGERGPEK